MGMYESRNEKTVKMSLTRLEVCDLLIALNCTKRESGAKKWGELHDKVRAILDAWDDEYDKKSLNK